MKAKLKKCPACPSLFLALAAILCTAPAIQAFPVITNIVETGGDNEATDTISARWTGGSFTVSVANEPAPGAVVGTVFTVPVFGSYAPTFVDRTHRYTNAVPAAMPPYLVGQEYIMSGNDNRDNAALVMTVGVATTVRVYMLIDNRLGDPNGSNADPPSFGPTKMQWIVDEGWTPVTTGHNRTANMAVPDEVALDEGSDGGINQWYSVYSKVYPAGTFQLKQANNDGQNMYGAVVVPIVPPPTPQNLTAANSDGKVTLTWPALPLAAGYNIKRSLTAGGPYTQLASTPTPGYMDSAVVNGTAYYYVVTSTNEAGESGNSNEAIGIPNASPTDVVAVGGTNQVTVSWSAFPGATGYTLKRSSVSGGPYTTVATDIAGTSHVDVTAPAGSTSYYVVIAQLSGGESGQSAEAAGTTAPGAPTLSITIFASTVLRVGWTTPNPVVTQFHVERSTDGMNFVPLSTVPATQRVTNSGLALNTTYHYRVQAENGSGFSPFSAVASGTTPVFGINVNFANGASGQPANDPAPAPPGYLVDIGDSFGDRGNGYSYGWDRPIPGDARWRKAANSPDLRYDTFNHMIKATPPAVLELEMPNGFYQVRVVAGDPGNVDSLFQFDIEGAVTPTYTPTAVNNAYWADFSTNVSISDGRLTVRSGPASQTTANNNKICFIDIYPDVATLPVIGTQPQSQMVEAYHPASFGITITAGSGPLSFQWYLNDAPVSGATGSSLAIPHATNGVHSGNYHVVITNYAGSVTSMTATLTVVADSTAPVLVSAASLDGVTIGLCFSEEMDDSQGTLSDGASYEVETAGGPQPVGAAFVRPGGREVRLTLLFPSSGAFIVRANTLADLSGNPCTAKTATNVFGAFTVGDIGGPGLAGSHFTCDTNIEIIGGGADVWAAADQAYLATQPTSGNFDARVRVVGLAGGNATAKAVLVARETLNADSAGYHISVNPTPPGRNQIELGIRTNTTSLTGPWVAIGNTYTPAGIPNAWLRITRIGNVFTGYRSSNGVDWVAMGTNSQPYASTLQVGIGVTAHDNALLATGRFTGLKITPLTGAEPVNGSFSGGIFTAGFPTLNGFTYTVEYKNTVNPGPWTFLASFVGDGTTKTFMDPGPIPPTQHRIYRVRYQ